MASVFTFETQKTHIRSQWPDWCRKIKPIRPAIAGLRVSETLALSDLNIVQLQPEPQDGPIEYKQHLLLRSRHCCSGSPGPTSSQQSRQTRLQHLTTQLLWRLQQSSETVAAAKRRPRDEVPLPQDIGVEEDMGALYEIGVGDDGSLIGLTLQELEDSLIVLQTMASSLGCHASILKLIAAPQGLWIAEVLISPRPARSPIHVDQLRVSVTGATTSGKSSLLGTLTTTTLDNGHGKSRLNLLRHRHEIVSGITSSLAQEIIGYPAHADTVVNYASSEVSSWADIHRAVGTGRLVFLTDSAGHTKFRRTTVRGLISWEPHWVICCIAANEEKFGDHLDLCLQLGLQVMVTITKMDLAHRVGLRKLLANVMTVLKAAQRNPLVLVSRGLPPRVQRNEVPIVLTSAVDGSGIEQVHALLRRLPNEPLSLETLQNDTPRPLFHVDDVLHLSESKSLCILSGYVRYGAFKAGDELHLGPLHHAATDGLPLRQLSQSLPHDLRLLTHPLRTMHGKDPYWVPVRIASIRFLRLPTQTLYQEQVGTIAVQMCDRIPAASIRRGMVLVCDGRSRYTTIRATFAECDLAVKAGDFVTLNSASVRAAAKIVSISEGLAKDLEVTLQLVNGPEWVELGTKLLVTSAGISQPTAAVPKLTGLVGVISGAS